MARVLMRAAIGTWRTTYIGYNLEDMTKWWVAACWGDERKLFTEEELDTYQREGADVTRPWWVVWVRGQHDYLYETLSDLAYAFDNYRECQEYCAYCAEQDRYILKAPYLYRDWMPLNVGDYIRWEDGVIDNHSLRKLGNPKYKASQRFFANKPAAYGAERTERLSVLREGLTNG